MYDRKVALAFSSLANQWLKSSHLLAKFLNSPVAQLGSVGPVHEVETLPTGILLYKVTPLVQFYWTNSESSEAQSEDSAPDISKKIPVPEFFTCYTLGKKSNLTILFFTQM